MRLNPYHVNLKALIQETQEKVDLSHLKSPQGVATWDSSAWQYIDSKGRKFNCYFTKPIGKQVRFQSADSYPCLPNEHRHLLMVYALDNLIPSEIDRSNKASKMAAARTVLSEVDSLGEIDNNLLEKLFKPTSRARSTQIGAFIAWLQTKKLINSSVNRLKSKRPGLTGDELAERKQKNLPDEKVIMALGAIFHDVLPVAEKQWDTNSLTLQRDAVICTSVSLCLGAPNRMLAEVPILDSQLLKTHTGKVNGESKTVHYLNWKGSKGFKNNNNHIMAPLAPAVERALKYLRKVTEPNRVLARFYTKPDTPLKDILLEFKPSKKNWDYIKPNPSKPTNLFALGVLLGCYNDLANKKAFVENGTKGASKHFRQNGNTMRRSGFYEKEIAELTEGDKLLIGKRSRIRLFGYQIPEGIFTHSVLSLREIQHQWIAWATKDHPKFPIMYLDTEKGSVDARHAMFALNGYQFSGKHRTFKGAASFYSIVAPESLRNVIAQELRCEILQRHGFSKEFRLRSHQLRHLLNDTGEKLGISHEVLNLWSGRKSPEQLLHYIYRTDGEKADEISDIMFSTHKVSEDDAAKAIRVVSMEKYQEATNDIASITSSGVCVQNLTLTPCSYYNDFETQCILCPQSCHVAHDDEAIKLIECDVKYQRQRIDNVVSDERLHFRKGMQDWFKAHHKNVEVLEQLLELMKDPNIKKGSFIRLVSKHNEFRITDLDTKTVACKMLSLTDTEAELAKILTTKTEAANHDDDYLNDILEMI
ncbi:MAG: hypothetical protein CBB67_015125 [Alteromonadaceae bacterium TMED7]|nr:MAG: hypothetical protein CBB67_015125 [Alteromonadaceae bacterium TMED7]|tara:strand:- start:2850 stop:5126 length:2277 start_codon:yes stop_codon:yes gene_type:complete